MFIGSWEVVDDEIDTNLHKGPDTVVFSDCRGLRNPCGLRVGSARVRVRVGCRQPLAYPDPDQGLAVTHEKTRG